MKIYLGNAQAVCYIEQIYLSSNEKDEEDQK